MNKLVPTLTGLLMAISAIGQEASSADVYSTSSCLGCHGQTAMGGLGPPLAKTKLSIEQYQKIVREGQGMMPATTKDQLSDQEMAAIFQELKALPYDESQIPIAFKVGQLLSTRNVGILFLFVGLFSLLASTYVLSKWLSAAGLRRLLPYMGKLGWGRTFGIGLKSLVVDGFFVGSLWRTNKKRWAMHGLMLYGMTGLLAADILMQIFNPTRGDLPLVHPLKMLPIVSGIAVFVGVTYVMLRYRLDKYIDNGLTLGRDFLFVNLLFHAVVSGFLTVVINRTGAVQWVMPIYLYHLATIALLLGTAPFTRFQHAFVVPCLVAMTRITEAIAAVGADIGYRREPSPGRHHKTERIAAGVMSQLGADYEGTVRIRYYP